jgi:hypothetical protein
MATAEERMQILKMIQEGKISAEQGVQLLEAVEEGVRKTSKSRAGAPVSPPGGGPGKWFRVQVTDTNSGKTRVNVRLPVSLINAGIKMGARFAPQVEGLDAEMLMQHLNSGETGRIIDVYNDEQGEHVEVFIE